jgi:hypothetical protein
MYDGVNSYSIVGWVIYVVDFPPINSARSFCLCVYKLLADMWFSRRELKSTDFETLFCQSR